MTDEQLKSWVFGLMEKAEQISDMLDAPTVPAIDVAELTGYAKSSLALLSNKAIAEYRQTHPKATKDSGGKS